MIEPYEYLMPTGVVFGPSVFECMAVRLNALGKRPLVVTGRLSAHASGLAARIREQLPDAVFYDGADENPTSDICEAGARIARDHGCDCVVGVGGGSAMDVAKAVAGLALNDGPCQAYFGKDKLTAGALPILAIPTTAGTGSEVTPYAVIVDSARNVKATLTSAVLFPRVALCDPLLTVSMPSFVTACTGLDALSQCMEAMVSRKSTPPGDALALEGIRLIREWLPVAVREGANLEARGAMMHAAMLSGCAIAQAGTTLVHGMGYYYTIHCGIPHGLANGLILSRMFALNAIALPEKTALIAKAFGADGEGAEAIHATLTALMINCGVPSNARDAGVREDQLAGFASDVASDPYRFRNQPGEVNEERILEMYRASYEGRLPVL